MALGGKTRARVSAGTGPFVPFWPGCVLVRQLHSCPHPWRAALGPFVLLSRFGQGSRRADSCPRGC